MARFLAPLATDTSHRVVETVRLLGRRGYALTPAGLGRVCMGGAAAEAEVRWAVASRPELTLAEGLVVEHATIPRARDIFERSANHDLEASRYLDLSVRFVGTLVRVAPFIRSVSIAGSLASGGFRASDDVDLNLIVDDGCRHLAYVAVNALGLAHAFAHRNKPVDDLTRRPIAPRLMTANLILERSQCHPLQRQDEDMAFELLMSEPVYGLEEFNAVIEANPALADHFPQLATKTCALAIDLPRRTWPRWLYPRTLDGAARLVGEAAWRYMQWTRRKHPEALARVAFVRRTMRPYTLFDR